MSDPTKAARRAAMLIKVRKLMNMARDGRGSENEEATALRQANKLMAEYGIAEAECDMAAIEAGEMVFGESKVGPDGKPPAEGRVYRTCPAFAGVLAVGVARFTGSLVTRRTTVHGQMLVFQGEKEDVLLAQWLFAVLVQSIQREQKRSGWTRRGEAATFRSAAASALHKRLKALAAERIAMYQAAQAQSESRALVVVDRKAAEVEWRFGVQRTERIRLNPGNHGAREAGQAAGREINIPAGRPIAGGGRPRGYLA